MPTTHMASVTLYLALFFSHTQQLFQHNEKAGNSGTLGHFLYLAWKEWSWGLLW